MISPLSSFQPVRYEMPNRRVRVRRDDGPSESIPDATTLRLDVEGHVPIDRFQILAREITKVRWRVCCVRQNGGRFAPSNQRRSHNERREGTFPAQPKLFSTAMNHHPPRPPPLCVVSPRTRKILFSRSLLP